MPGPQGTTAYDIVSHDVPTFYFIGVTTGQSSIMRVFPLWMRELGRPEVAIEGVDLVPHDRPEHYRRAVAQIKHDPLSLGALITTHKIDLFEAARDMFDSFGPYAQRCGEVSCIVKRGAVLEGYALDPVVSGISLDNLLGGRYFARTGGAVLCFGAGGAATAIALHLIDRPDPADRPRRFAVVNRSPGRLARLRQIVDTSGTDITFDYIHNSDPLRNDALMGSLPDGSLVINATGMGKDRPGSPITDAGRFPRGGVAWELNYRGELDFLQQARAQREPRNLTIGDGWQYFSQGWTRAIATVLDLEMDEGTFARLADVAAQVR